MSERTKAGLKSARARGKNGGRRYKMTRKDVIYIQAQFNQESTVVAELARELKMTTATIYNYFTPKGELTDRGQKMVSLKK